ncbi:MAG: hypothetical protein M1152_00090 [Actinobacteria bacterium]|nr:hypothetical protein [Actinomycetota bacterium]
MSEIFNKRKRMITTVPSATSIDLKGQLIAIKVHVSKRENRRSSCSASFSAKDSRVRTL